jgi:hypothetical protein
VPAKGVSGRAACRWRGLSRTVLRYPAKQAIVDQARLGQVREASQPQPRFGYRRIAILAGVSFKTAWRLPLALRLRAGHTDRVAPRPFSAGKTAAPASTARRFGLIGPSRLECCPRDAYNVTGGV